MESGREVNIPNVTNKIVFSDSYIAAEVPANPNDAISFTIGDGLYYHGYYNIPLEPGCTYRVHVRIVTMAMDEVILLQHL